MLRVLLDANNDIPPGGPELVSGIDSAAVALQAVFGTQQGEWVYDLTFGTPWRDEILQKYFDAGTTRSICARVANTVPDIEPVVSAQIDIDTTTQAANRQADITLNNVTADGEQADISVTTAL